MFYILEQEKQVFVASSRILYESDSLVVVCGVFTTPAAVIQDALTFMCFTCRNIMRTVIDMALRRCLIGPIKLRTSESEASHERHDMRILRRIWARLDESNIDLGCRV